MNQNKTRSLTILGIRGVPAAHGGFETFAEVLAPYLVGRGWDVTVFCQGQGNGQVTEDDWRGVRRIHIPVMRDDALGTIEFDWRAIREMLERRSSRLALTLGYNTALFCGRLRWAGVANIINMDGIEWRRDKWRPHEKAWLWINELAGCWFGNQLVADHPEIARHLATRIRRTKVSMIPYGSDLVIDADPGLLGVLGLIPAEFALIIARPEPENLLLEVVRAFSRRPRGKLLVVLGNYRPESNPYHAKVMNAASEEVRFVGAIYERPIVDALRCHAHLYIHGHTVGGTNPSLVEALGAGSPVLAHDNRFNRWVAGPGARYFCDEDDCARQLDQLLGSCMRLDSMREASLRRHAEDFTWEGVLSSYENLLERWMTPE